MLNKNYSHSNADTQDDEQVERNSYLQPTIVDVWAHNFTQQLTYISQLAQTYSIISLDTEFPGNPIKKHQIPVHHSTEDVEYQLLWHNVEKTKLIQIGITLADPAGNLPITHSWQFHLAFDLSRQSVVPESIALLKKAGISFQHLPLYGIPPVRFSEGLISSGLILNKTLKWVVFHGCYDLAYLLKLLRDESLPTRAEDFYKSVHIYFPNIYDLKQIVKDEEHFRNGGLNSIAAKIGCEREGPNHQAGSDSLLTIKIHFALRKILGESCFQQKLNLIYGISRNQPKDYVQPAYSMTTFPQNAYMGGTFISYFYSQHKEYLSNFERRANVEKFQSLNRVRERGL